MNEDVNLSCAIPHHTDNWHSIIWRQVIQRVRRLQIRIAKAVKEGRWGKAKALMYLVSKSFYAKLLAVFRVTSNKGGTTPGVDNIVWLNDLDKLHAARSLKARGYTPLPLRRVYILKKNVNKSLLLVVRKPTLTTGCPRMGYTLKALELYATKAARTVIRGCKLPSAAIKEMNEISTKYFIDRKEWRKWLETNFETEDDIWMEYPLKKTGKKRILYNDAVEEALCFGWIDSTVKSLNKETTIQRFCKRRKNSSFSQPNIERLKWLFENNLIHDSIRNKVLEIIQQEFIYPEDIIIQLKVDKRVWANYQNLSEPYKRIRIAYIDNARKRPDEFDKRLNNFIEKTKENKLIKGFGGIDKYY